MAITINNLSKKYDDVIVFDRFRITFEGEKIHCLFGPSGCGKTTLLNIIAGLESLDAGQVVGLENRKCAYVFQEERLLPWRTVHENIAFVLKGKMPEDQIAAKVDEVLELVQLEAFRNHYPEALSGGMKQRVSLARAFAYDAEVLLLDEPFKGLHLELKLSLMDYVVGYWLKYKPQIVFTTHDQEEAVYLASDIYFLEGPPAMLINHMIIEPSHQDRRNSRARLVQLSEAIHRLIVK